MKKGKIIKSLFLVSAVLLSGITLTTTKEKAQADIINLTTLVKKYQNNGVYTKKTNINVNDAVKNEVEKYFHGSVTLDRTTYYNGDYLLMTNIDGTLGDGTTGINSGYRTDGSDMKHFQYLNGNVVDDYTVKNTGIHSFYVTLNKLINEDYFSSSWVNGEYVVDSNSDAYVADFLAFAAPCLTDVALTSNYFTISKLSVSEEHLNNEKNYLSMKIYVDEIDIGKINRKDLVLSEARIYLGNEMFDEEDIKTNYDVWDGSVATSIAKGTGTEADPYVINSGEELAFFSANSASATYSKAHYKLGANINLNNNAWTPIQTFYGTFDGNGKKIIGLKVDGTTNLGLFAISNGATIRNMDVDGTIVGSSSKVAVLVGNAIASNFNNCVTRGSVVGGDLYTAGFAGMIDGNGKTTTINNCTNYASVKGKNTGTGGITSYTNYSIVKIENCKNYGDLSYASHYVGGIVGRALKAEGSYIKNSYNFGNIAKYDSTTTVTTVGGIIGDNTLKVENCYNYEKALVNGYSAIAGTVDLYPKTAGGHSNLKGAICGLLRATNLSNSDVGFVNCGICDEEGNVIFDGDYDLWNGSVATSIANGTGTEADPYQISSGAELAFMGSKMTDSTYASAYYKVTKNIHLNNKTWTSIGLSKPFQGHFDGNGKTILGLSQPNQTGISGLFAVVADAYISNLTVIGNIASSAANAGILVGRSQIATISNCTTRGTIVSTIANSYVGGLVASINKYANGISGTQTSALIENCTNYADVTGLGYVASIMVTHDATVPTRVIGCKNYGTVTATGDVVGGLCAIIRANGELINSINYGEFNATGTTKVGIIVGTNAGKVTNCYTL